MILFWFLWVILVLGGLAAGLLLGVRLYGWKLQPVPVPVPQRRRAHGGSRPVYRTGAESPGGIGLPSPRVVTRAGPGPAGNG
jgi:hypothetical protein